VSGVALPNRRVEAWKYSDLRAALRDTPLPVLAPEGAQQHIIEQLASALGAVEACVVAEGESAVRVDRMVGNQFEANALHITVGPGAQMTRIVLQDGDAVALNLARVTLARGARYQQFVLAFGARLARIETHVDVDGEGAHVALNGAYLCAAGRHCDVTSVVSHRVERGVTRQLVRGAVRAGGCGVFQGKIYVAPHAQKTDAEQHHDALLLEEGAEVNAKPELEIYADDVACAHGNTIGALDESALFYMRARAIPEKRARALLTRAFIEAAIPDWTPEALHTEFDQRLDAWLEGAT
jgi:Fe-S cluster assembly protein SufD